jgi:hypothetical protein
LSIVDEVMAAAIGTSVEITERVDAGSRFIPWRRITLAPTLGLGHHVNIDTSHKLAAYHAPTVMIGLELGWLF